MERLIEKDKDLLIDIVSKCKTIVENKKTDSSSNKEKLETWSKITLEYNSKKIGKDKTQAQLKMCYSNMKAKLRREMAHKRKDLKATGGGPAESVAVDENNQLLSLVLPSITPCKNPFDSNGVSNGETEENTFHQETFEELETYEDVQFLEDIGEFAENMEQDDSGRENEEKTTKTNRDYNTGTINWSTANVY